MHVGEHKRVSLPTLFLGINCFLIFVCDVINWLLSIFLIFFFSVTYLFSYFGCDIIIPLLMIILSASSIDLICCFTVSFNLMVYLWPVVVLVSYIGRRYGWCWNGFYLHFPILALNSLIAPCGFYLPSLKWIFMLRWAVFSFILLWILISSKLCVDAS